MHHNLLQIMMIEMSEDENDGSDAYQTGSDSDERMKGVGVALQWFNNLYVGQLVTRRNQFVWETGLKKLNIVNQCQNTKCFMSAMFLSQIQ